MLNHSPKDTFTNTIVFQKIVSIENYETVSNPNSWRMIWSLDPADGCNSIHESDPERALMSIFTMNP